jgi:hypothetical protein
MEGKDHRRRLHGQEWVHSSAAVIELCDVRRNPSRHILPTKRSLPTKRIFVLCVTSGIDM